MAAEFLRNNNKENKANTPCDDAIFSFRAAVLV